MNRLNDRAWPASGLSSQRFEGVVYLDQLSCRRWLEISTVSNADDPMLYPERRARSSRRCGALKRRGWRLCR